MAISFSGLATGMDTNALIDSLMGIERAPLARLEVDKSWQSNRLAAFKELDTKLNSFLGSVKTLSDREQYFKQKVSTSSTTFFTATASNDAIPNTNYQVEVQSLAQLQKSYSNAVDGLGNDIGFSSKSDAILGTGDVVVTVGTTDHTITLDSENNSLEGLMTAINDADIGVTAAIVNDGTTNPYRLTLTAQDVESTFSVNTTGLTGGSESFQDFEISQAATQAHIQVDGLDIYSNSNTIADAIPGVTLDLAKAELGTKTQVNVNADSSAVSANINAFVTGYNSVMSFITGQSTMGDTEGGILGGDSGLNSIKRHLQDMLTNFVDNNGSFKTLSQLGLETQKNGTIIVDSTVLNEAIDNDLDGLVSLLGGEEDGNGGVAKQFEDYLSGMTNSNSGMLAGREESINANIEKMESRITQMELRLVKREETMKKQFLAMEQLVSVMNAQSSFLTQQMSSISNLWNKS